ncbi:hypothetical protein [Streptomyces sp. NPDC004763]
MTDVLISGVLGAAVLAIVLLYRSDQRKTRQLNELRAEVTAQKIAARLQRTTPAPAADELEEEPARRKKHLALYIGGGAAAILAALGDRFRSVWSRHRVVTAVGAAVTVATVTTAAGFYLKSADGTSDTSAVRPPMSSATGVSTQPDIAVTTDSESLPPDADGSGFSPADVGTLAGLPSPRLSDAPGTAPVDEPGPSSPPEPDSSRPARTPDGTPTDDNSPPSGDGSAAEPDEGQGQEPGGAPNTSAPPPPGPGPSTLPPTAPETTPKPTPKPEPSKPGKDCTIHVQLPPLLDLCL